MTLNNWIAISRALGILAALGLVLCFLALHDIAHGEADVRTEWVLVQIGLYVMGLFIVATLVTFRRLRRGRGHDLVDKSA
jgi:uncharacterized membrane protein